MVFVPKTLFAVKVLASPAFTNFNNLKGTIEE